MIKRLVKTYVLIFSSVKCYRIVKIHKNWQILDLTIKSRLENSEGGQLKGKKGFSQLAYGKNNHIRWNAPAIIISVKVEKMYVDKWDLGAYCQKAFT